jgi:hypothetical protein
MIVGLCRFSYLAKGGWARHARDMDEQTAYLFAEERLDQRLHFFETLTLPSISQQTHKDFAFVVLSSTLLPKKAQSELQRMLRDVANAELVLQPPQRHREVIRNTFNAVFGTAATRISFRIDDDDALSVNYIQRLKDSICDSHGDFFISFCRGITVVHDRGKMQKAGITNLPFSSVGLALYTKLPTKSVVYDYPHQRCFSDLTTFSVPGEPTFIRNLHEDNDSGPIPQGVNKNDWEEPNALLTRYIEQFPYIRSA